jgi:acyl-coenzyme A thioesterase PaaI-like protein
MAHGGYLCSIADTGMGNAAHQIAGNKRCVTISLDIKFIAATTKGQKLQGKIRIQKKTNTLVFVNCEINSQSNIIATASGVWKILK